MATIYIPGPVNCFIGDDGEASSKHLQLAGVTLPPLEEKTAEHHAGGSIGAVDIGGLGLGALTIGVELSGFDPQAMGKFGLSGRAPVAFTIAGLVRDKATGRNIRIKAVAFGRLTKLEKSQIKGGEMATQTHEIKEILRYFLWWDGAEKYAYDWAASVWRVDGVDQWADARAAMLI